MQEKTDDNNRRENETHPKDIQTIIKENSTYLYRFICKKVRNKHDAEDIMQSSLLEAVRVYHKFRGESHVRTWLCGIAYNVIRNEFKRRAQEDAMLCSEPTFEYEGLESDYQNMDEDPADTFERNRLLQDISRHYDRMTDKIQDVVHSLIIEENSYQQTADLFDIPLGTVRSRMSKAREVFRDRRQHFS
ncbi:RNA polymerase sigma factor [Agarilytica rhodophyticola]|uniref:RNA polymerase sigma factor n=1 Tax=Agarilytica rhodophyticola TaxID=1737490 RepID=UPI000B349E49|nr:sigma-70 family RNA polymerase sigma factor [Agarilytica rhodophyticola]